MSLIAKTLRSVSFVEIIAVFVSLCGVAVLALSSISDLPPRSGNGTDHANLIANIFVNGVFSEDASQSPTPHPSMGREPGYPAAAAFWLSLFGSDVQPSVQCIADGQPDCVDAVKTLKQVNAAILVLIGLTAFLTARIWFASPAYGFAALLSTTFTSSLSAFSDRLLSEPLAAFLLLLASALIAAALARSGGSRVIAVCAGFALGGLILTKAVFLYFGPFLLAAGLSFGRPGRRIKSTVDLLLILAVAYAMAGAWVWRNYENFGVASIALQRSVISIRAEYSTMTWPEYWLAYIAFTPQIGPMLLERFVPQERHAKLSRDNPDGYYKRGSSESGVVATRAGLGATTEERQRAAFLVLRERWAQNLALVPLFAYRGSWMPIGHGYSSVSVLAPVVNKALRVMTMLLLLPLVPAMFAMFALALRAKSTAWLIFLTPSLYSFALHAAVTHYIPRYSQPLIPCLLMALLGLIYWWRTREMAPSAAR